MLCHRGLFFPDGDEKVPYTYVEGEIQGGAPFVDRLPTFQFRKFQAAMPHIRNFRHYVDIGAHVGLWARPLARLFDTVTAFEPIAAYRECFMANTQKYLDHVTLYPYALGAEPLPAVEFRVKAHNSGTTHIKANGELGQATAEMKRLDDFKLTEVDFIKIDVEGYEMAVIQGGERTIKKWHPTIIVEQKPGNPTRYGFPQLGACELLKSWGATQCMEWSGDYGFRWKT
jgi:FkbM family methyltransferase